MLCYVMLMELEQKSFEQVLTAADRPRDALRHTYRSRGTQCWAPLSVINRRPLTTLATRDVHGNGKDRDPMGPMGFPWEWKYDQPWDGNGMGMGLSCVGNGN